MMREEIKVYIRGLMAHDTSAELLCLRDLSLYGHRRGPAFDALFDDHLATAGSPEQAYAAIVGSSMQSNVHVNKDLTGTEAGLYVTTPEKTNR